jgi:acyl-CoA synthetase (AMP-forming)/AMP-acid ligase II
MEGGEIFITGRVARKLIVRGRNIYAEDVEGLVQGSQAAGCVEGVAAIGIEADGSQQLCLLIELARRTEALDIAALNAAIVRGLGVKPSRIAVLRGSVLPRTTSGKIRHSEASTAYLAGAYEARITEHVFQTGE